MAKTVTYNSIVFLHHEEIYEVRKNKTGTIKYYTRVDTGESGMSLRGLANACGVSHIALRKLFEETTILEEVVTKTRGNRFNSLIHNGNDVVTKPGLYLIESPDLHVMRDTPCEQIIYYYAFESRYKKTKARELYRSLAQHGLRSFIQAKTGYRSDQASHHDASLQVSIEAQLKREVEELKLKLTEKDNEIHNLKYRPVKEKTYQAYLQGVMGGSRELFLSGPYPGRVDLVTDQMIVEVKRLANFESAFGQLLRYRAKLQGSEHEGKAYVIYLFGTVTDDERRVLDAMARMANFQLMIEQELQDYLDEDELSTRDKIRVVVSNE